MDAARKRLEGARFRFLNEKLYTSSSAAALRYFRDNPSDYERYHVGFRTQVAAWPVNPVDLVLARILQELRKAERAADADNGCAPQSPAAAGRPADGPGSAKQSASTTTATGDGTRPPIKRAGLAIADLGCGDAKIKAALKGGPAIVHAFDLLGDEQRGVIAADMCSVPLPDASIDIVVFSLSLMNTNHVQALREARRILRPRGLLLIAEVESRMRSKGGNGKGPEAFVRQLATMGFRLTMQRDHKVFLLLEFVLVQSTCTHVPAQPVLDVCLYKKR